MNDVSENMEVYYRKRAQEYEKIYGERGRPDRQQDLATLREWLRGHARDKTILEIAAGTGYWTAVAAPVAKSIVATDYNAETLALCAAKKLGSHVTCSVADAYQLPTSERPFDLVMAHLWWSHVKKVDRRRFLTHAGSKLADGGTLLMIDENFVDGFSTALSTDEADNTYQTRTLESGETFRVVKNYPSAAELRATIGEVFEDVEVLDLRYYWAASARISAGAS